MTISGAVSGISLVVRILIWFRANWGNLKLRWQCLCPYRNKRIRVSMAYLFRIKVGDEYLLVRGNRIPDQYQPPGGVYKYYEGARDTLDSLGALSDVFVKYDGDSKDDLRRVLQRGSKLPAFLRWFHSKHNREQDPWREFHEELIASGILDREVFSRISFHYNWVRSVATGIQYSPELDIHEYLFADVYELLPSDEQVTALNSIRKMKSDLFGFVDERCIRSYGQKCGIRIASHTWKILEGAVEPPRRS